MAKKSLVIVESPAKAKTLEKFLGKNFSVKASGGHIRDLPKTKIGVEIENNFNPKYITIKAKSKTIKELKEAVKSADITYLAADPDREGEAISWHLANVLSLPEDEPIRLEFYEITKNAVLDALKHPRPLDKDRINAQQARRIMDRLVGYLISPLLWRKIKSGLSAGRVQSVAVRLICDRENEIKSFVSVSYWSLTAFLSSQENVFPARFLQEINNNEKINLDNKEKVDSILDELKNQKFIVDSITKQERKKSTPAPFITSTLAQEASRKLGFNTARTMRIAQSLYEGTTLSDEITGLITYMRTDSVRISDDAQKEAREYISKKFGVNYLPAQAKTYKTKKTAQDAHEAIHPTSILREPQMLQDFLNPDEMKLYKLIWERFLASQMEDARLETTAINIHAGKYLFRANGSTLIFDGFLNIYQEESETNPEDEKETSLPELKEGEELSLKELVPKEHFTQPPPRYTEASLVKALEENGIGRPSTYAPIMATIQGRGYIIREGKVLTPTEIGLLINGQMVKHFPEIVNLEFTAQMENELDEILEGKIIWTDVIKNFYTPFALTLKKAETQMERIKIPPKLIDENCPNCGKQLAIKRGKFGEFLACSGFPDCRFTKPFIISLDVKCPVSGCGGTLLQRKTRKGKIFYGCSNYPKCNFALWDKPLSKNCPICNSFLVEKSRYGKLISENCSNEDCSYLKRL